MNAVSLVVDHMDLCLLLCNMMGVIMFGYHAIRADVEFARKTLVLCA